MKRTGEVSSEFVSWWLKSSTFFDQLDHGNGATVDTLTINKLRGVVITIPPLVEQQRIVRLLDEAFEGIAIAKANAEKNLQNARTLFEGRLQSVFAKGGDGWETKKLSEIATHSLGKMLDKAKNKGEFQPYLRNLNVRWAEFDLSDVLKMRFLPSEAERYTVLKGDVLVCEGGYPGRAAIWAKDEPIYFQKALHRVRFHEIGRNRWFIYYLIAKDADGTLKTHFNGTGIQHFTGEALARFEVPLPPLREQDELLDRLDDLHEKSLELSKTYSAKVTALDDLKGALLSMAFSGNLKAA
jgi:type I restriction enzyme S subunit